MARSRLSGQSPCLQKHSRLSLPVSGDSGWQAQAPPDLDNEGSAVDSAFAQATTALIVSASQPSSRVVMTARLANVPAFSCGRQRERSDRQARLLQRLVGQRPPNG